MKIKLPEAFVDERGAIQNLLALHDGSAIHGVSIIRSLADTTRSNHWHREDGHWLYVITGTMHYFECDLEASFSGYPKEPAIYGAGQMVYTGPRLWHKTFFPVYTELLSLSLRARDHASHEADVVRA